jgi:cell division protein ZipA
LASELRWILVAICVPLLIGIWWWGTRRSRQSPGNAELRESTATSLGTPGRNSGAFEGESGVSDLPAASRDWGVPPFEPLSIRTADFDQVQIMDLPMTAHPDSVEESLDLGTAMHEIASAESRTGSADKMAPMAVDSPSASAALAVSTAPAAGVAPAATGAPASSDTAATGSNPQGPNVSETQRIVTVRVSAVGETRWDGPALMAALENHGLAYGRYQVFHRRQSDGRTLFCAASLVEPGTFNLARMPEEQFRGLTLFAVLPGPAEPLQTLDALILTAGELAETLHGVVQDSKGVPLSQQRADALREDVARFQAMLTMS